MRVPGEYSPARIASLSSAATRVPAAPWPLGSRVMVVILPDAPDAGFSVASHRLSADGRMLHLELKLPQGFASSPRILVTGPEGHVLTVQKNGRHDGTAYWVDMPLGTLPKGYDIHGKQWGILVAAGAKAIETTLAFD